MVVRCIHSKNNTKNIETGVNEMNRRNIMKEVKESGLKLGKLKLDLSKYPSDNITKTITFIAKNLQGDDLDMESLKYALASTRLLDDKVKVISEMKKSENINLSLGKSVRYDEYLEFNLENEKYTVDTRYFDMSGRLPTGKNGNGYTWRDISKGRFSVYNGKKLVAISKLCDELEKHLLSSDGFYAYKNYMISRFFYNNKWANNNGMNETILEIILDIYQDDISIQSMRDYEKTQSGDYALSFMTKKNIKKNTMTKMENNEFLGNGFAFVEVDNDTDLAKLESVEKEWVEIFKLLPKVDSDNVDLRFRKLGNHKATGLYYPTQNCICVDIREVSSMIHEYGHLIDYKMYDGALSLSEEFRDIIKAYTKEVNKLPEDNYVAKKKRYYTTPTEIFARGFELYMSKRIESSFLKDANTYVTDSAYTCFTEDTRIKLEKFFNEALPEKVGSYSTLEWVM